MTHKVQAFRPHGQLPHPTPIFAELMLPVELMFLRVSPTYYGYGVPRGNNSAVILIPGLVGWDLMLFELHGWLKRVGYRPYYSGIGFVGACPHMLVRRIEETVDRALADTGYPVHLIGHSLGGIFARSLAVRRPKCVASVITLASPFRGLVAHGLVLSLGDAMRAWIRGRDSGLPFDCATSRCPCPFGRSLQRRWPKSVLQTAIFSKTDGLVDWRYCLTGRPDVDIEVSGTHLGLPFNTEVYACIAERLASAPMSTRDFRLRIQANADARHARLQIDTSRLHQGKAIRRGIH